MSKLLVLKGNADGVVNIEPSGVHIQFGAVLGVTQDEVACLLEGLKLEFFLQSAISFSL